MRKLFLVALVVGVCTPAIMAQETTKAGIYGGIQNLRFHAYETSKRDAGQESEKVAIYGGISNLHPNVPEPSNQEINSLPQAPKPTFFSATAKEIGRQYAVSPPLNSRAAAAGPVSPVQCPPNCAGRGYNRFEIYGGYSLMSVDFRFFRIAGTTIGGVTGGGLFGSDGFFGNGGFFDNRFDFFERRERRHANGGDVSVTFNFSRYFGAQFDFSAYRRRFDRFNLLFLNDLANNGVIDPGDSLILANISRPRLTIQNYLAGVQVKDNSVDGSWARPFAHFLVGASRQRLRLRDDNVTLISDFDNDGDLDTIVFNNVDGRDRNRFRRTSFALAVGGGLDLRVSSRFSIRAFKFDYFPVFARPPVLFLDLSTLPIVTLPTVPTLTGRPLFFLDNRGDRIDRKTQNNFRIGAGVVFHF
ncbi:MAG TPA: hypothetical protein VFS27_04360 [Blastocatellia bacterium]|jgi:hypothetical protein|nr:hypothetical protein [Blastocatellia bacterium]